MKKTKTFTIENEVQARLEKLTKYFISIGLPFNYSRCLEYLINNEYIELVRNGKIKE